MSLLDPRPVDVNLDREPGDGMPLGRFGRYLLFKRVRRDELGDVYRAGQLGADAIERVVALRLFNAAEIDGESFQAACRGRVELHETLRGGPFAEVVDLGSEDGVPFVAHEFVFGRSLAELLVEAREQARPVPLEHTLHLMDRIAIGLQNAYETRLDEKRVVHGFLVPHFVHVSSEGEVRLSGFEWTGGLLGLSAGGPARTRLAGYLSPEVNAGRPPHAADDVYSLGSLCAELVTGEPLPALDPGERRRWLDVATTAAEEAPIPEGLRDLLCQSLAPADERLQSVKQWHRNLIEITTSCGRTSTTFDLAFYMHTLFGHELELETELVEAEMQADLPATAPPLVDSTGEPESAPVLEADAWPAEEPLAASESRPAPQPDGEGAREAAPPDATPTAARALTESKAQAARPEASSRKWTVVAAGGGLLLALVAGYFTLGRAPRGEETAEPMTVAAAPRPAAIATMPPAPALADAVDAATADSEPAAPAAPSADQDELESQVRALVAERAGDLEANLKAEYDQRLVELRRQLEQARQAAARAPEPPPVAAAVAEPTPAALREDRREVPAPTPARPTPRTASRDAPVPPEPLAEATPAAAVAAPEQPTAQPPRTPAGESAAMAAPEPAPAPVVEPAAPVIPEPAPVEPGSTVEPGPGVTPPKLVRQPRVVYPPAAARLKRQATVRVRVLVDGEGKPSRIEQVGKNVGLGFDAAALTAARTTRWTAPRKDGVPVKMWVELSIDFRP